MPKIKKHTGMKKRFQLTSSGKIKRKHAFKRHNLRKRTTKQKRHLTHSTLVHPSDAKRIQKVI